MHSARWNPSHDPNPPKSLAGVDGLRAAGASVMFAIVTVPDEASTQLEQLGTKAKFWYRDAQQRRMLCKLGRPGTGENWAEKACCEIARHLGLPHAEYELAVWKGQKAVVTPMFVPEGGRLVHGNELLAKIHPGYEEARKYGVSQHTLRRVVAAVRRVVAPPLGWACPAEVMDGVDAFAGYLLLDALVGNQDRHHENWGIVFAPGTGITLAPTFDHASSLGRNETDESREERLNSRDRGRSVDHYVTRARSGFFRTLKSSKPMSPLEAFVEIARMRPAAARYWLRRLDATDLKVMDAVFRDIPPTEISDAARRFALKMIEINRQRLLSVRV